MSAVEYKPKASADDETWYWADFSPFLRDNETLSSVVWTLASGITNVSEALEPEIAYIKIGGGTAGLSYRVTCKATTSKPEIRTAIFYVTVQS
jgi:hypothetical protein